MEKATTNLSTVLGIIVIGVAGYYLYTQKFADDTSFVNSDLDMENVLKNANIFIERSRILNEAELNLEFFDDERLLSLRSYSTPILDRPVGRDNPFSDTGSRSTVVTGQ
ncbi:hypothetical protein KC865_04435 [Candidatus Kaiserbacteria bacterium]|nr:hypothetical protein [Candidatus Kaiserbacteria bacterium]USN92339.1 MAG: hypothetical protein H6782_00795 [Candidatus Nomurabacteria bacterium]